MYFSHAKAGVVRAGKAVNLGLGDSTRLAAAPAGRDAKSIFSQGVLQFTRSVDGGRPPCERSEPGGESFLEGRPRPREWRRRVLPRLIRAFKASTAGKQSSCAASLDAQVTLRSRPQTFFAPGRRHARPRDVASSFNSFLRGRRTRFPRLAALLLARSRFPPVKEDENTFGSHAGGATKRRPRFADAPALCTGVALQRVAPFRALGNLTHCSYRPARGEIWPIATTFNACAVHSAAHACARQKRVFTHASLGFREDACARAAEMARHRRQSIRTHL